VGSRTYSWRDGGVHVPLLRALNVGGAWLQRAGLELPSLHPESLLAAARRSSGLEDFGDDSFLAGLEVLCASLQEESGLTPFGRMALRGLMQGSLEARLRLVDWVRQHPEVRQEEIRAPFVILGLPRTGTTLLSFLLDLDPRSRSLLQWEADALAPPPTLAGVAEDPRIAATARKLARLHAINPAISAMHPMGATLPTECVTLFMLDFRSLLVATQAPVPSYGRWLEKAPVRSTYAIHKLVLQTLQASIPTGRWSLKTPQHLWHLEALREAYPDARLIWTHRDPVKVVASTASLNATFFRSTCRRVDPAQVGVDWAHQLHLAVSRGVAHDGAQSRPGWCCHVHYALLRRDPVEAVRRICAHFDEDLDPLHVKRMRAWLRQRRADTGRHRYRLEDFGLLAPELRERFRPYTARFEVPEEDG